MNVQEAKPLLVEVIPNFESIDNKITQLRDRGYHLNFRREASVLVCIELNYVITPDNFSVDEFYHFEDITNTDRDRMLYAISTTDDLKGFLVDTSFVYEDNISPEMFKKLNYYEKL